jgi:hypothetical protein
MSRGAAAALEGGCGAGGRDVCPPDPSLSAWPGRRTSDPKELLVGKTLQPSVALWKTS